jgi:hypothetical protein
VVSRKERLPPQKHWLEANQAAAGSVSSDITISLIADFSS